MLLMVLALMGIGGVVLTGFTQGVKVQSEHERYLHNQRVLREAKQALLQYAYNYPVTNGYGPGRLPCPDTSNNGNPNPVFYCGSPNGIVGRFPWADTKINFYDALDASGERLWYAVSSEFANQGPLVAINSDTAGTITIQDRSSAVIYDGTDLTPAAGVAAVIIAPGAAIARAGVMQNRAGGPNNPANYLDLFGAVDNADFINGDADNGFVTGPILDVVTGDLLVNDQMIVVTAAEVIAMAEKATLQAYREAINVYLGKVGCIGETPDGSGITEAICLANGGIGWNPVYPWLYNYRDVFNTAELSSYYPAFTNFDDERDPDPDPDPDTGYLDNYGRIPSIFAPYFTEVNSQAIETWLSGSMTLIDPSASDTFTLTQVTCDASCGTGGPRTFEHDPDPDVEAPTLDIVFTQPLTGVGFVDIDPDTVGDDGRITATFPAPESVPFDLYFLGDHNDPGTNWTACPGGANELSDCNGVSINRSILHLQGTIDFSGDEAFDFDYTTSPTIAWWRASGASHAWITGTYPADAIISFPGVLSSVTYEYEGHWHPGDTSIETSNNDYSTGTVDMTGFSLASLTLGMRYFPELPNWALQNGWHNAIRMAYADNYLPSLASVCVPAPDGDDTNDCLTLPEELGAPRNIASLLVIAGEHDWVDDNADAPVIVGLEDELRDVFDNGNNNNNRSFYSKRSISPLNADRGNDKILVIEEL